jgi:hypothetical protein
MHIDQLYPSRFLRCADLAGRPMHVTIAGVVREEIGGEQKAIMSFTNGIGKSLILNKTNARAIAKILGNETRDWNGHDIVLVPAQVDFRGDVVDAIRVKAAPARKAAVNDEPDDEEVSF